MYSITLQRLWKCSLYRFFPGSGKVWFEYGNCCRWEFLQLCLISWGLECNRRFSVFRHIEDGRIVSFYSCPETSLLNERIKNYKDYSSKSLLSNTATNTTNSRIYWRFKKNHSVLSLSLNPFPRISRCVFIISFAKKKKKKSSIQWRELQSSGLLKVSKNHPALFLSQSSISDDSMRLHHFINRKVYPSI